MKVFSTKDLQRDNLRLKPVAWILAALVAAPASAADLPEKEKTLGEIVVGNKRESSAKRPYLRNEIAPVESCTVEEFTKSGATNINEALDKRPGVAVQVECSICNARFISLNNLPGRYTTLLIDGVPLFSAVSQAYGLDSVGLRGLERIDLMRGAGASGLTPDALAGTVNMVTRRPVKDEGMIEMAIGQYGSRRLDAQAASAGTAGAVTANIHTNQHDSVDGDDNGVSEYTGYYRKLGGIGFFVDDLGGFKLKGRIDAIDEKRNGGALGTDYDAIKASRSGNPFNFSRGAHASPYADGWVNPVNGSKVSYTDGRTGLSEIIFTQRQSAYVTGEKRLGEALLNVAVGYARHDQDSFYEGNIYKAKQNQGYLMGSLKAPLAGGVWTVLADWRYEDLRSQARLPDGTPANGLDNYTFRTPGLGVGANYALFDEQLEVGVNLRGENHNVYGTQLAPRVNLLWHHNEHANSRLSMGQGYRAPTSYFEQDHGILKTLVIRNETGGVEKSKNLMYSFDWQDGDWKFLGNAHYTKLDKLAYLDVGATESVLRSASESVKVKGLDMQLGYQVSKSLAASLGLEAAHYDFPVGTLAFARPDRRIYLTADWDSGPLDIFVRATWTGPQNLKKFYYRDEQHYNFDGSAKPDKSPAFWTVDTRIQYAIDKRWAVFAGADNIFNFKQSDHDGMLWVNADGAVDVTHIWGPNRGRFVYGGLRFEI
ncbi:TonB-dependent receptor [Dechloromonas denitrificans]|uniref:TonB-dependent receptor plug domain-containing protein n=1 Tax=Dechloromonas denitrificans TaxID=281362 RepID=UPI001CF8C834|nr:TonB-dependent receptor [Dechloromonas denitrificans]UCV12752.1 TonB-dependent receptor [Dechloromonas denitrificans]